MAQCVLPCFITSVKCASECTLYAATQLHMVDRYSMQLNHIKQTQNDCQWKKEMEKTKCCKQQNIVMTHKAGLGKKKKPSMYKELTKLMRNEKIA